MSKKTEAPAVEALSYSFSGLIDEDSVEKATKRLHKWSLKNPGADLEFLIHSGGGAMLQGWRLFDTLRHLSHEGHEVTTVVRGEAASFGAVLFQAGDTRVMGAQSWLMIHEPSTFTGGALQHLKERVSDVDRLAQQSYRVLAKRSNLSVKDIEKNVKNKDWYLDAKAAKAAGLADKIEGEK